MAAALPFPKSDARLAEAGGGRTYQGKTILSEVKVIPEVKAEPETKAKVILDISGVFRGRELTRKERRLPCGIAPIDQLIGGGIVRGRVSEIIGNPGAGRTSLAAAFAASSTGGGEVAAWIDAAGSFDPESMAAAGVDLARLLWVAMPAGDRANETEVWAASPSGSRDFSHHHWRDLSPGPAASDFSQGLAFDRTRGPASDFAQDLAREIAPYSARELDLNKERYFAEGPGARGGRAQRAARAMVLKAAEWILAAGGFGLVVIDCGGRREGQGRVGAFSQSAALRLARGAEGSGAAVVVIGAHQLCGTFAALSLMLSRRRAGFSRAGNGAPVLFEGLTVEACVMRNKLGGAGGAAIWRALAEPSGATTPACAMTPEAALALRDSHASRERTNPAGRRSAAL
jgi:hypothetical protein